MKTVAFIFSTGPHGTSAGREGLDMILATTSYIKNIAIFFIDDGILQLVKDQKPEKIFSKNYIATFRLLLFEKKKYYICLDSLQARGLTINSDWILPVQMIKNKKIRNKLNLFDLIINL